ncbi:MAG: radical SAM protein [Methanomassiliicoccales archaeon]|nr:radical SAM protein [Methanomassiliicoccales archaeon]NYT15734.1 radical SAM protein [Methanomassiliicoccales archaeon]
MISFGPVPSRRLGRSLGVNNIPPKTCTYSCVYCQLGRTSGMTLKRSSFFGPKRVLEDVGKRVSCLEKMGERIDYIAFVPDGEPTLDRDLGSEISGMKELGYPVAVITNSSLLSDIEVREELAMADWVSLKADAALEEAWRAVDRPHGKLTLEEMIDGMLLFKDDYEGTLCTETMLINGLNDTPAVLEATSDLIADISPNRAYLSIPVRPPAEGWALAPDAEHIILALTIFMERGLKSEMLSSLGEGRFSLAGDIETEILRITSVHPMDKRSLGDLLKTAHKDWTLVDELMDRGELISLKLGNEIFYMRNLGTNTGK